MNITEMFPLQHSNMHRQTRHDKLDQRDHNFTLTALHLFQQHCYYIKWFWTVAQVRKHENCLPLFYATVFKPRPCVHDELGLRPRWINHISPCCLKVTYVAIQTVFSIIYIKQKSLAVVRKYVQCLYTVKQISNGNRTELVESN